MNDIENENVIINNLPWRNACTPYEKKCYRKEKFKSLVVIFRLLLVASIIAFVFIYNSYAVLGESTEQIFFQRGGAGIMLIFPVPLLATFLYVLFAPSKVCRVKIYKKYFDINKAKYDKISYKASVFINNPSKLINDITITKAIYDQITENQNVLFVMLIKKAIYLLPQDEIGSVVDICSDITEVEK